jgi:hypothetical protein
MPRSTARGEGFGQLGVIECACRNDEPRFVRLTGTPLSIALSLTCRGRGVELPGAYWTKRWCDECRINLIKHRNKEAAAERLEWRVSTREQDLSGQVAN